MTARTITLTLTDGQYDALAMAASEGADSPDLAAARDALEQAWADAAPGFPIVPPGELPVWSRGCTRNNSRAAGKRDSIALRSLRYPIRSTEEIAVKRDIRNASESRLWVAALLWSSRMT